MKDPNISWLEKEYSCCLGEIFEAYNHGEPSLELLERLKKLKEEIDFYKEVDHLLGQHD